MTIASRSRPVEPVLAAFAAGLASILFLTSWALLHRGFYNRDQIVDTPVYYRYGSAMDDGRLPYRDFALEYPPGALPAFAVPALGDADFETFRRRFGGLMAACGLAMVAFVAAALAGLGAGARRLAAALGFVALAPLLLGSVVLSRFDLWPAALTAAALAALVSGRDRLGHGVLGAAIVAKLYPAVLVPLVLAYVWKRKGRSEAIRCGAVLVGAALIVVLPFLILSPGGVWDSFTRQASRPLQIESLGSALLLAAHQAFGLDIVMDSSHGSQNLAGNLPDALAMAHTVVQVAALAAIWVAFARGPADRERLVLGCAAALTAFVALGKVLSPQFLIWLIPIVPLVGGRRGVAASAMLGAAMVLTQLWFPFRYWDLALEFDEPASWLVLVRDLALLALLAVLALGLRERHADGLARGRAS
jgi:glycosyl transferase family 87